MSAPFRKGLRKRPSDAARWTRCHGALEFTKHYPNESTDAANDGTLGHYVRQECLDWGMTAYDFIDFEMEIDGKIYKFDADYADAIQPGIDEIEEFEGRLFVETWVDTTEWVGLDEDGNRQGGTVDALKVGRYLAVMSDLKAGRGVAVSPVENDQQILYMLAAYDQIIRHIAPECKNFLIIIDQPRHHAAEAGGYWSIDLATLRKHGERIKAAAEAVDAAVTNPEECLTPSPKACQWCPAANVPGRPGGCPAHAQGKLDDLEMEFEDLDDDKWEPPLVAGLTPDRLMMLSEKKKSIENFLEYAHAMALQYLLDHGPTAGKKAVAGRKPPMKWADDGAAEAFLKQKSVKPFNQKLITPTQAKAAIGKKYELPSALVERGEAKPTIVDVGDARPAIRPIEDEFDEEDL